MTVEAIEFDVAGVIERTLGAFAPVAKAKGLPLFCEIDASVSQRMRGDPTRLGQVLGNLLSNAIKFSPPGGTIQVHLAAKGDEAMLCVSDSGRGIDAEFLPHVFQLFKQADSTTRRNEGRLGIGLAMAKRPAG